MGHHPAAGRFGPAHVSLCLSLRHRWRANGGRCRHSQEFLRRRVLPFRGQDVLLLDEERGVGGDDAVPDAQLDDGVHPLPLLAVEPNLCQQVADLARGPQPRDEACGEPCRTIVAPLGVESALVVELPPLAVHLTGERDAGRAALPVAAHQDQLRAREEVGQRVGVGVLDQHIAKVQFDVRQDRRTDLGVETGDLLVNPLVGADVAGGPPLLLGQRVQKDGVNVVADAEGE